MIYLFTGSDVNRTRQKAFAWVAAARAKAPEAPYIRILPEEVSEESLSQAAGASGLFFSKSLVVVDDPFSLKDSGETVLEHLKTLAESPNAIAILAPKLLAAQMKKLEGKAEKVFTVDAAAKKESRGFNSGLVNALAARDGKALWLEVVKAMREGDAPEMIHGLLHWKARDIMTKGARAWSAKEARELSLELIELQSEARSGGRGFGEGLEAWSLGVGR